MKRLLAAVLLLLCPGLAYALPPNVRAAIFYKAPVPAAVVSNFVGFGDLTLSVSVVTYNGVRCYKKTSTANIADIADSATGTTTGTRLKCDGAGNVVAVVSSSACAQTTGATPFITGGNCSPLATTCASSCSVLTLWDQTANLACNATPCDLRGTVVPALPLFLPSTQNGYGAMRSVLGNSNKIVSTNNLTTTVNQPLSVSAVGGKRTDTTGGSMWFGTFSNVIIGQNNVANAGDVNAGANANFTMSDSVYHSLQAVVNGSSSQACVDSSACNTGLVSGSNNATGAPVQMFNWFGQNAFDLFEGAILSGSLSGADITAITNNQHSSASGYNF